MTAVTASADDNDVMCVQLLPTTRSIGFKPLSANLDKSGRAARLGNRYNFRYINESSKSNSGSASSATT